MNMSGADLSVITSTGPIILKNDGERVWRSAGLEISLKAKNESGATEFFPEIINSGDRDAFIEKAEILHFERLSSGPLKFMRFGFNMPGDPVLFGEISKSGFNPPPLPLDAAFSGKDERGHWLSSNTLLALSPDPGEVIITGAGSFKMTEGTIFLRCDAEGRSSLSYSMILDGLRISAGQSKKLDSVLMIETNDINEGLRRWAEITASRSAPRFPKEIPAGWNDWQFYRNEKTQEDVLSSAEVISELKKEGFPLGFVQIDGGFCLHLSEWRNPKPSFSMGMRKISEKISAMGLKFGLWFAPYIQNLETSVVKEHPDWLLLDSAGKTVTLENSNVGPSALIDYTVPGTLEWLRDQIIYFTEELNVKWIKLDGPNYALYRKGKLRDSSKTIHESLLETFNVMRAAAGDDVIIEGEGPMGLALGSVGLQRVQTDNHPVWVRNNSQSQPYAPLVYGKELCMAFLHKRWWCNHRENVILRDYPSPLCWAKTFNPDASEEIFTENELRVQLVSALLSPGALLLTDPMRELVRNDERMKYIHQLLPVFNAPAEILDSFPKGRFPSLFRTFARLPHEEYFLLGIINWSEETENFKIPLSKVTGQKSGGPLLAFSFFDGRAEEIHDTLSARVSARGAKLFALRRKLDAPQLVSTDMHMSQGAVDIAFHGWREDTRCLEIMVSHFYQRRKKLFLHTPSGMKISRTDTNAGRYHADNFDAEWPVIVFDGAKDGNTCFKIYFEKDSGGN